MVLYFDMVQNRGGFFNPTLSIREWRVWDVDTGWSNIMCHLSNKIHGIWNLVLILNIYIGFMMKEITKYSHINFPIKYFNRLLSRSIHIWLYFQEFNLVHFWWSSHQSVCLSYIWSPYCLCLLFILLTFFLTPLWSWLCKLYIVTKKI